MITLFFNLIAAAGNNITSTNNNLANIIATSVENKKNRDFQQQANEQNIQLQRDINQQNIDEQWKMWHSNNAYNSPVAQMARYREAGLNPHLMYGQSNTASAMNVGLAQAPRVEAPKYRAPEIKFGNVADTAVQYMQLLSMQESLRSQELENDLLSRTIDNQVEQSNIKTRQMILESMKTEKEIERIGIESYVSKLDGELKEFELSLNDVKRNIMTSEETIKANQAVGSSIEVERSRAQLKLEEFQINLEYARYVLLEAQTAHELAKIGLTETEKSELLKKMDLIDAEIQSINKSIDRTDAEINNINTMSEYYVGKGKRERATVISDIIGSALGGTEKGLGILKALKILKI